MVIILSYWSPPPPTRTPLQVYPGDTLLFDCPNGSNSNAWYQVSVEGVGECGGCGRVWKVWVSVEGVDLSANCNTVPRPTMRPSPCLHSELVWDATFVLSLFVSPITEGTSTHHQIHHLGLGFVLKCYQSMCIQCTIFARCSRL